MIAWIQGPDALYEVATGFDRSRLAPWFEWHRFDTYALMSERRSRDAIRRVVQEFEHRHRQTGLTDRDVADTFVRLVESGDVQVNRVAARPVATTLARGQGVVPDEPESLLELAAKHFVEFRFVDSKGNAVGGLPYVFTDSTGEREPGTLGRDGRIRRDHIEDGTYGVELETVVSARWESLAAPCDDEVMLRARVTGCSDGTAVTIRIFREFSETDDDVIATVQGEVSDGEVAVGWRYDYTSDEERRAAQGTVAFIAEVSLAGGSWAKTIEPLTVTLKTIELADWSHEDCPPGTEVELFARVAGISDTATATFSVFRTKPQGDGELVETLDATTVGAERIAVSWTAPERPGEFYFEVEVDDTVGRKAVSDFLCVLGSKAGRSSS